MKENGKTFDMIKRRLEDLSDVMGLTDHEYKILLTPEEIHESEINQGGEKFFAWRIVHNRALGPGKGGIRFHPDVTLDEVKSLAFWMTIKNSLAGIPYGGAKGGIKFNPKEKSLKEIEEISRQFIRLNYKYLGQDKDIPAPDVYTNEQTMAWMLDEYEIVLQKHEPGMITGKPVVLGGIKLRSTATARGGFILFKELIKNINKSNIKIAIQGLGNAGLNVSSMIENETKYKIVAVSDSKGGTYNKNGLDISKIKTLKKEGKSVMDYKNGDKISNSELLELKVDVLILAALENQITKDNADKVQASHIIELANGPTTYEADKILNKKNVKVIPDILANSGGVVVSYFEWAQNKSGGLFEEEFLQRKLTQIMKTSWEKVMNLSHDNRLDFRNCAYIVAIKRILEAEKFRGRL